MENFSKRCSTFLRLMVDLHDVSVKSFKEYKQGLNSKRSFCFVDNIRRSRKKDEHKINNLLPITNKKRKNTLI